MIDNIQNAVIGVLESVSWLDKSTKVKALEKVCKHLLYSSLLLKSIYVNLVICH